MSLANYMVVLSMLSMAEGALLACAIISLFIAPAAAIGCLLLLFVLGYYTYKTGMELLDYVRGMLLDNIVDINRRSYRD